MKPVQTLSLRAKMNHIIVGNKTACGIEFDLAAAEQAGFGSNDINDLTLFPIHCKECAKHLNK